MVELYEDRSKAKGEGSESQTTYSSYDQYPITKLQQSYFLDAPGVSDLAVTNTQHGITSKLFLVGLNSNQVFKISKQLLDPRRPTAPDDNAKADKLWPYHANITASPMNIISYTQRVHKIRGIVTNEAVLESTSLAFVYGLDLFFSRITPSQDFDLLSEDFNAPFLIVTVVGIIIATIVTGKLARRKDLFNQWA